MPYPMLSQVTGGFTPSPRNKIESITFRYTSGINIDYEDESAELLMSEILRAIFFASQLEFLQSQQADEEEPVESGPAYHGQSFRDFIRNEESKVKPPKES